VYIPTWIINLLIYTWFAIFAIASLGFGAFIAMKALDLIVNAFGCYSAFIEWLYNVKFRDKTHVKSLRLDDEAAKELEKRLTK
jgi:hypothetical protein